jgi:hypothetical protein
MRHKLQKETLKRAGGDACATQNRAKTKQLRD